MLHCFVTFLQARLAEPDCPDKLPVPLTASTTAATSSNSNAAAAHTGQILPPVRTLLCGEPLPTALRPGCVACFQTQHPPETGSSLEITLQCSDSTTLSSSASSGTTSRGSGSVLRLYVAQCAQQPLSLEGYPWQGVAPQLRVLPWCTDPAVRACPVWIAVAASKLAQQQQQQQPQQQLLHVPAAPALNAAASGTTAAGTTADTTTAGTAAAGTTTAATADTQDNNSSSSAAEAAAEHRAMQLMREHKSAAVRFTLGVRALAPPRLVRESTWTAVPFCTSPRAQQGGVEVEASDSNVQAVEHDLEHALPHVYMTLRLPSPMLQCAASTGATATASSGTGGSSGLVAALTAAKGELHLQAFRDSEPVVRVQVRQSLPLHCNSLRSNR
jgi:hypothetical protein